MSEVQTAALMLAATTLVFALVGFFLWHRHHNSVAAARGMPRPANARRAPIDWKFPRFARREPVIEERVEMDPARLARIRVTLSAEADSDTDADAEYEAEDDTSAIGADAPVPPPPQDGSDQMAGGAAPETIAMQVEPRVHRADSLMDAPVIVRLVPQIVPRGDEVATSWLGGRPCLDPGVEWPKIRELPAVFLAQIACSDLPADLWDGLGPRIGALAIFVHPRDAVVAIIPVDDPGEPIDAPHPQSRDSRIFAPADMAHAPDLLVFARAAFPPWPVKLITVRPGDPDPQRPAPDTDRAGCDARRREGFDVVDPAFHPFDWDSMIAMVDILALRIAAAWPDGDDALPNGDARARAEEIIAIVRDSAGRDPFAAQAAAAVMEALHQISWTPTDQPHNPDDAMALPLTVHNPRAPLWAHDYRAIWFDHAKHAYVRDPGLLSPTARAQFESEARTRAAHTLPSIGHPPQTYVPGYDSETHVTLIELPSSGLLGWAFGDSGSLALTMRKADLAAGRWDRVHARFGG